VTVRILVADDQALIRAGLVALFRAAPGLELAGEAENGERAVALARELRPDIALVDIRMPVLDGIEATRRILADRSGPAVKVVVLTTFDLDEYVYAALSEGASGFLLKDTPPERIVAAMHTIAAGDILVAPRITARLVETFADHHRGVPDGRLGDLTPRETDVLRLVGNGLTNAQIADRLTLSEGTVKSHLKHAMAKLQLSSRAQAVVVAYESGLVVPRRSGRG
jgi:DNA-binding NarL/FixJ family response regulator